ncbi:unnamed protein product [Acanthoscelides obtectus]|uniref:Uncharacterized protein n=1 Tax=Acanthoscelides obtectus TaxID=200917 RepID=A0A9P0MB41_ACAOB|nr:unnamed protein product [Acanthoscelides obtectus]CAK1670594.1 hypothetical protein AOBTE_LOCUS27698 [Acanthoscelides obtectus]
MMSIKIRPKSTQDINEGTDKLEDNMEHFKKRFMQQCDEDTTAVDSNGKEAGSEEKKEIKMVRKKPNCRSKFRHKDLEIYKLGSNTVPTSLCKTKEPYDVCKEKNLQEASENSQNEPEKLSRSPVKGRHSMPAVIYRVAERRKNKPRPTQILQNGSKSSLGNGFSPSEALRQLSDSSSISLEKLRQSSENSGNSIEKHDAPLEKFGSSLEKPVERSESVCDSTEKSAQTSDNSSKFVEKPGQPLENCGDTSGKPESSTDNSRCTVPITSKESSSQPSTSSSDSVVKTEDSIKPSSGVSPTKAVENKEAVLEKPQESASPATDQKNPINLCVPKTQSENEIVNARPRIVIAPAANNFPVPIQRNVPTKPTQKIIPISINPEISTVATVSINQAPGIGNTRQQAQEGVNLREGVLRTISSLIQDRFQYPFSAESLFIVNNWYKYLMQNHVPDQSTPLFNMFTSILRQTEDFVMIHFNHFGSGSFPVSRMFVVQILMADLKPQRDLLIELFKSQHRSGDWLRRLYETLCSCIPSAWNYIPQLMPAPRPTKARHLEDHGIRTPQKPRQRAKWARSTRQNSPNVASPTVPYLHPNSLPGYTPGMYVPQNFEASNPNAYLNGMQQQLGMMNPLLAPGNYSEQRMTYDTYMAMLRQLAAFQHSASQQMEVPFLSSAPNPVNMRNRASEVRFPQINPMSMSQQTGDNLPLPVIRHPQLMQGMHFPGYIPGVNLPREVNSAATNIRVPAKQTGSASKQVNPVPVDMRLDELRINGSRSALDPRQVSLYTQGMSSSLTAGTMTYGVTSQNNVLPAKVDNQVPVRYQPESNRVPVFNNVGQSNPASEQRNPDVVPVINIPEVSRDIRVPVNSRTDVAYPAMSQHAPMTQAVTPMNSEMQHLRPRFPEQVMYRMPVSVKSDIPTNDQIQHRDNAGGTIRRDIRIPAKNNAATSTIFAKSSNAGTTNKPCTVTSTTMRESRNELPNDSQGTTEAENFEKVIRTHVIVDPLKTKNISDLHNRTPHTSSTKDLSQQLNGSSRLTAAKDRNQDDRLIDHNDMISRNNEAPTVSNNMTEQTGEVAVRQNECKEWENSETELILLKGVLKDQFKDSYPEILRRVTMAKEVLEKRRHRNTDAAREKTLSVHSDSTSSMLPKRKTEDGADVLTKKMKHKLWQDAEIETEPDVTTSLASTTKPSLPIIEDISSEEDSRSNADTAKRQKPDPQFRLKKPTSISLSVPNPVLDHSTKPVSYPKPQQQLLVPNLPLSSQMNNNPPPLVPFSLPLTPESPQVPLPENWQTWLDEERLRGNSFFTPVSGRRQSIETISSAGSDYSPRLTTDEVEIKIDSKWYRVKRNVYERMPKGKLYYIQQKNMLIRYFDDNQMEQFYKNIGVQSPNPSPSDLNQMKACAENNAETLLIPSDPSQMNEVIEIDKEVTFSTEDQLSEPEMYVEEIENVRRYAPKDFFGFYQFVTGYQIVRHNCPISFHMFLVLHNTNRIKQLLYEYVNALMNGQCIH